MNQLSSMMDHWAECMSLYKQSGHSNQPIFRLFSQTLNFVRTNVRTKPCQCDQIRYATFPKFGKIYNIWTNSYLCNERKKYLRQIFNKYNKYNERLGELWKNWFYFRKFSVHTASGPLFYWAKVLMLSRHSSKGEETNIWKFAFQLWKRVL
jgi:hypothetical protein